MIAIEVFRTVILGKSFKLMTLPQFNGFQIKLSIMGTFEFLKIGTFRTSVRRNISLHMLKSYYALFMQLFQQALIIPLLQQRKRACPLTGKKRGRGTE